MYSNLAFLVKRPFRQLTVICWTLPLFLVVGSTFYFITSNQVFYHQQGSLQSPTDLMTKTDATDLLFREKRALEESLNVCRDEKKNLATLLDADIKRKVNTMFEKVKVYEEMIQQKNEIELSIRKLREEKKMLEVNKTFNRELFAYMATHLRDTLYPGVENYTRYTVTRLGLLPLAGIEPLKPEYGPVINNVTSFGYPITVPACQTSANQSVFIAVISSSGNFDKRNTIRQTWRTHLNVDYHQSSMSIVGFAFILGIPDNNVTQTQIEEESKTHGDIIQIGMSDFYRNLSLKVAGLFNWLYNFCPKIDFLFKVDDDVYVNVRNLAHFVQSHNRSDQSVYGKSAGNLFPVRAGKWGLTVEEWPWKNYPRYFYGPGVIFPGDTIIPFVAAFQTTPLNPIDDLYYSGICAEKAGVKVRGSIRSTSVFAIKQPAIPIACSLRLFISWLTGNTTHMNNSHFAVEDFYHNRTQCVIAGTNGTNGINTIVDYLAPTKFDFS